MIHFKLSCKSYILKFSFLCVSIDIMNLFWQHLYKRHSFLHWIAFVLYFCWKSSNHYIWVHFWAFVLLHWSSLSTIIPIPHCLGYLLQLCNVLKLGSLNSSCNFLLQHWSILFRSVIGWVFRELWPHKIHLLKY